jgi:hypothetical protein
MYLIFVRKNLRVNKVFSNEIKWKAAISDEKRHRTTMIVTQIAMRDENPDTQMKTPDANPNDNPNYNQDYNPDDNSDDNPNDNSDENTR